MRFNSGTVEKIIGTNKWRVREPFYWYVDYEKKDWAVFVEEWFVTDYWSIPKILQSFLNPTKYNAYIAHDKLYKTHLLWLDNYSALTTIERKEADKILIDIMEYEWASTLEKMVVYIGVRLFGWIYW